MESGRIGDLPKRMDGVLPFQINRQPCPGAETRCRVCSGLWSGTDATASFRRSSAVISSACGLAGKPGAVATTTIEAMFGSGGGFKK